MLESAGSAQFDITLHDGEGRTDVQWYFREETSLPVAIQRWRIPPGGSEGRHTHPPSGAGALEEIYVLVGGTAVMTVGDETFDLVPGDAVLARAGAAHDVTNHGDDAATLLVVWGPPGTALDWTSYRTGNASREAAARNEPRR